MKDEYEIIAVRYATRPGRRAGNFLGGDPHDADMPLDYYFWVVRNAERMVLVDTGFNEDMAAPRGRTLLIRPVDALRRLGIAAGDVRDTIITHLHNDHAGTVADYPNAHFHIQDDEMAFATGRHMCHRRLRHPYFIGHVLHMVQMVHGDRVTFHKGEGEVAPGITVHQAAGHSPGLQAVRVRTRRGFVVLASDASHHYEHVEQDRCFPVLVSVVDMLESFRTLRRLADGPDHIIPGHDPLVMARYPSAGPELEGLAVRLDREPLPQPLATAS